MTNEKPLSSLEVSEFCRSRELEKLYLEDEKGEISLIISQ